MTAVSNLIDETIQTHVRWSDHIIAEVATESRWLALLCRRAMAHDQKGVETQCSIQNELECRIGMEIKYRQKGATILVSNSPCPLLHRAESAAIETPGSP